MQKTHLVAAQDKTHIYISLLIKPAIYQLRVVCLFLILSLSFPYGGGAVSGYIWEDPYEVATQQ